MKIDTLRKVFWKSLVDGGTILSTVIGVVVTLVFSLFVPNKYTMRLDYVVVIVILFVAIIFILLKVISVIHKDLNTSVTENLALKKPKKIKVISVKTPPKFYSDDYALFIVDPTPLLSFDSLVTVFYLDDGVEKLVGVGKVINIQEDKKVQIIIINDHDFEEKLNKLMNNSLEDIGKLVIKTSIPNSILQNIIG